MKKSKLAKCGIASAAVAAALLGAAVLPGTARAATPVVNPAADLAAQPADSSPTWVDSIYVNSFVSVGGQQYGIVAIVQRHPNVKAALWDIALTNITAGWSKNYGPSISPSDLHWSTSGLDISAPGLSWTGNAQKMTLKIDSPDGNINFQFVPKGPAFDYAETGAWSMLGDTQYEYAFPSMQTTGTLTANGTTKPVSGLSWLDRQWGDVPLTDATMRWTWMSIRLPNHDVLGVWDVLDSASEKSFATLEHPDGSYQQANVTPVAGGVYKTWTSPHTGNTYPTGWHVQIPSLNTSLNVSVVGPNDQETVGTNGTGVYEVPAAFTGTYEGHPVSGVNYVEQVGDWKS